MIGEALAPGGTSFDSLYVNVNGAERLLRPSLDVYGQERPALPALRHADPPRAVHEPLLLQLPAAASRAPRRAALREPPDGRPVVALVAGHVQGVGIPLVGPRAGPRSRAGGLGAATCPTAGSRWSLEGPDGRVSAVLDALDGPDAPGR